MVAHRRKTKHRRDGTRVDRSQKTVRRLPLWKKFMFSGVAVVVFFGLLELLLAVCGVDPILYSKDPYVGFSSIVPLFETDPEDDSRMRTARNKLTFFNDQHFAKKKPKGTYRIYCLGGSTTYGRPYDDGTSFCGWLRELLPEADSDRDWELVNAGGISYASYRVALLMEELIQYEPDLFIIYSGHNEFLEERTYREVIETPKAVRGLGALASRTRLFAMMSHLGDTFGSSSAEEPAETSTLEDEVVTRLDGQGVIGPQEYTRDESLKNQVLDHYRFNLSRMVEIASSAGAKVIFVSPASNLKDCSPFKSEHDAQLADVDRRRVETLTKQGQTLLDDKEYDRAERALGQALAISPKHAHLHYLQGQALLALGKRDRALVAFEHARDEDICPLRALAPVNKSVAEIAEQAVVPLVDFDAVVRGRSKDSIPGEKLFLDHVHPTILGNRLLALEIIDAMRQDKIIAPDTVLNSQTIERVTKRVEDAVDPQAHAAALRNLSKVLKWAGRSHEAERLGAAAGRRGDPEGFYHAGTIAQEKGRIDDAIAYYRGSLELKEDVAATHKSVGELLETTGQIPEAIGHYQRAVELAKRDAGLVTDPRIRLKRKRSLSQAHTLLGGALSRDARSTDIALGHLREAIELDSTYPHAHDRLAVVLYRLQKNDESLHHFREAARLAPGNDNLQTHLITMLIAMDQLDDADAELRRILKKRPLGGQLLQRSENLARAFATRPEARLRDGPRALFWAEHAAKATRFNVPEPLDTLAAAYAESNRFTEAIETAQKAIKLADGADRQKLASEIRGRLRLYEQGKPARIAKTQD